MQTYWPEVGPQWARGRKEKCDGWMQRGPVHLRCFVAVAGEGMLGDLGTSLFSAVWRRPSAECHDFDESIAEWCCVATSSNTPWLCPGDYNDVPTEQPLALALAGAVVCAVSDDSGYHVPSHHVRQCEPICWTPTPTLSKSF